MLLVSLDLGLAPRFRQAPEIRYSVLPKYSQWNKRVKQQQGAQNRAQNKALIGPYIGPYIGVI